MLLKRFLLAASLTSALNTVAPQAMAEVVPVTFRGKVVMADGSAPGKSVGTERVCSDTSGTGPGPLTNKNGEYLWRMDVDFMRARRCFIHATLSGYQSTEVDISSVNPAKGVNVELMTITLTLKGSDPYQLGGDENSVPPKAKGAWSTAMKAIDARNIPSAVDQMKAVTEAAPKFALGWQNLGILYEFSRMKPEAKAAYQQAIAADPKFMQSYVTLARLQEQDKEWDAVLKTCSTLIPMDKKRLFPEMYVHQAVAQYNQKNLAAAEASAMEAITSKDKQVSPRGEYVLGRILEAKGDMAGAKQHMTHYLELQPAIEDAAQIKAHIDGMGQAGVTEPEMELLAR